MHVEKCSSLDIVLDNEMCTTLPLLDHWFNIRFLIVVRSVNFCPGLANRVHVCMSSLFIQQRNWLTRYIEYNSTEFTEVHGSRNWMLLGILTCHLLILWLQLWHAIFLSILGSDDNGNVLATLRNPSLKERNRLKNKKVNQYVTQFNNYALLCNHCIVHYSQPRNSNYPRKSEVFQKWYIGIDHLDSSCCTTPWFQDEIISKTYQCV